MISRDVWELSETSIGILDSFLKFVSKTFDICINWLLGPEIMKTQFLHSSRKIRSDKSFCTKLCAYLVRDERKEREKRDFVCVTWIDFFHHRFVRLVNKITVINSHWWGLQPESKRLKECKNWVFIISGP